MPRLTDPKFQYIPAIETDVQATWRRYGWRPSNEKFTDKILSEATRMLVSAFERSRCSNTEFPQVPAALLKNKMH